MPVKQLIGISITVADLPRSVAFFRGALGLERAVGRLIDDPAWKRLLGVAETATVRATTVHAGEQVIDLIAFDPPGQPYPAERASNDQWFEHIALVTGDMQVVWERLKSGAPEAITKDGPQLLPPSTGSVTCFKFRDGEGHPLELVSFPPGVGASIWQEKKDPGILGYDHTAISVTDVDRSIAFYTELLGFRVGGRSLNAGPEQDRLDGLDGCEVDVVALEPTGLATPHVELLHYRAPPGRRAASEVSAADVASVRQIHKVDDLEAMVANLEAAGVTFVSPGIATLVEGDKAAAIRDPDGHMILLMAD